MKYCAIFCSILGVAVSIAGTIYFANQAVARWFSDLSLIAISFLLAGLCLLGLNLTVLCWLLEPEVPKSSRGVKGDLPYC
jgi:hypothetical protein